MIKILILSVSSAQPRKNLGMVKKVVEGLGNGYALVRIGPPVSGKYINHKIEIITEYLLFSIIFLDMK